MLSSARFWLASLVLLVLSCVPPAHAQRPLFPPRAVAQTVTYEAAPGPLDNPLKGYASYSGFEQPFPCTMAFHYVSWRELEPVEGQYNFAQWEAAKWDEVGSAGKHIVLRVYLEYPSLPVGVPQWLIDQGVPINTYTNSEGFGVCHTPNYDHPLLVAKLEQLIAAMGQRYNNNPRVAFVQAGLLGYWGEWHTYPYNYFPSLATQTRVIDALRTALPNKHILFRLAQNYQGQQPWAGFHDDYFPEDTDCFAINPNCFSWYFLPNMRASGRMNNWRVAPMGGEMIPNAAFRLLSDTPLAEGRTNWEWTFEMARRSHFSWIGPYSPAYDTWQPNAFVNQATFVSRREQLVRLMGYEYRLLRARHATTARASTTLPITIDGINQGIAPFYEPWPVEIAILRRTPTGADVISTTLTNADPRTWMPAAQPANTSETGEFTIRAALTTPATPGQYLIALGLRDPWTNQPKVRFANPNEVINGWTVLGTCQIVP
jgi:hypothetical protein